MLLRIQGVFAVWPENDPTYATAPLTNSRASTYFTTDAFTTGDDVLIAWSTFWVPDLLAVMPSTCEFVQAQIHDDLAPDAIPSHTWIPPVTAFGAGSDPLPTHCAAYFKKTTGTPGPSGRGRFNVGPIDASICEVGTHLTHVDVTHPAIVNLQSTITGTITTALGCILVPVVYSRLEEVARPVFGCVPSRQMGMNRVRRPPV